MLDPRITLVMAGLMLLANVATSQYIASAPAQAPTLLVYGGGNSVEYNALYNITVQNDAIGLEKAFFRHAFPKPKKMEKEFFMSQFIQDTWFKAHKHCKAHGMRLATFDKTEYDVVIQGFRATKMIDAEFWVSAAKLAEHDSLALYFPTLEPVGPISSSNNNNNNNHNHHHHHHHNQGSSMLLPSSMLGSAGPVPSAKHGGMYYWPTGGCVFLKVNIAPGAAETINWQLDDCDNPRRRKYFICEKDIDPPMWFNRV